MIDYDSPKALKALLDSEGLALKKRWGQNFLVNPGVREALVRAVDPPRGGLVWEIGPGLGCMTLALLRSGTRVTCFELDRGFIRVLEREFGADVAFRMIAGDALSTWRGQRSPRPDRIFGNLPYSTGATIVGDLLEEGFAVAPMVFLLQREVVARMGAAVGSPDYGGFSVLCRAWCEVRALFDVQPGSFYPQPAVVSTVVRLEPKDRKPPNPGRLAAIIKWAFAARRKTLRNNLARLAVEEDITREEVDLRLAGAGIDPDCRAETLPPEDFVRLAELLPGR